MSHFLSGTSNRKDTNILFQEIPHMAVGYKPSQSSSQLNGIFHFGWVCPFQIIFLVAQKNEVFHSGIVRHFLNVECMLWFITHCFPKHVLIGKGVNDCIWFFVSPQTILNKILFEHHLMMSTYLIIFRWQESCKSCRWENAKTTVLKCHKKKGCPEEKGKTY